VNAGSVLALGLLALTPSLALAQNDANSASDAAIDARIRASADAAESLQGPLDGHWTLVGADGAAIYAFQIVDKPSGTEPPEGVWRDLRRPAMPGDIGLIDVMVRNPGALNISFIARAGATTTIVLKSGADGVWSGQLTEGGRTTPVTLRRG
jgi:hypothetical protein